MKRALPLVAGPLVAGLLLVGLVALATGCDLDETPASGPTPSASIPEPVLPTARTAAIQQSPKAWMKDLPDSPPVAGPGERVWATVPASTSIPEIGIFTVEGIYDGLYSLKDRTGQRVDGVPPAVVHRASRDKVDTGEVVLFYTPTTPAFLGKVAKLVPGGEIEVLYDFSGKTRKTAVDHVQTPVTGIQPFAFVAFPKAGQISRGLVVALSDRRAFVRTASGHVESHPRAAIQSLPLPPSSLKVGARVRAFRWATGIQLGTVAEVLEPGLRYRLNLDGNKPDADYFFTSLFRP